MTPFSITPITPRKSVYRLFSTEAKQEAGEGASSSSTPPVPPPAAAAAKGPYVFRFIFVFPLIFNLTTHIHPFFSL